MARRPRRRRALSTEDRPLWPEGVERIVLDETDSTMAEAARRAPPTSPTWIMTRSQTAGRGRQGRGWASPKGNFAATYLVCPNGPISEVSLSSFQAALALYDTLALHVDCTRLAMKWPNDVLLDGRKVAGILLESSGRGARVDWLAIGFGVNLVSSPTSGTLEEGALMPVSLVEAGAPGVTQDEMLDLTAFHMALYGKMWRDAGFDALRRLWLRRAAKLGETIRARTPRETLHGTFETVDADGRLVLGTPEGRRLISAADVFFG